MFVSEALGEQRKRGIPDYYTHYYLRAVKRGGEGDKFVVHFWRNQVVGRRGSSAGHRMWKKSVAV